MSLLRDVVGAVCCCCCCLTDKNELNNPGRSRDLKRLSDWRAHPTLHEFVLENHIADGGFSEVWLARNRSTGEEKCLKVVNLHKPGLLPGDVDILRGEARFLRLLDHPNLLRCRDVFETKYHMVMVLDYLSGGQLLDHLHKVEHYSEAQAARLFAQVAGAVAYMHNLNIVHRDIKPENVMFVRPVEDCEKEGRQLRVKLIDLGMATMLLPPEAQDAAKERARKQRWRHDGGMALPEPRREAPRGCMGSPGFIAPEIVHGDAHTLAMDVYALGVLLFAMLTGRKPWSLRDSRNLSYAERSILEAPGLKDPIYLSLSSAARELLVAMMADDPRLRPSSAEVLRHPFLSAGDTEPRQPALDDVIKRRMAQLASLRRFRGLAFAMMASREAGQDLPAFTKLLTERRQALHRGLVLRAKIRRSVDLQRKEVQGGPRQLKVQNDSGINGKLPRPHAPLPLPGMPQPPLKNQTAAAAAVGSSSAPASPPEQRISLDSSCSQQPLLQQKQQCHSSHDQRHQSITFTPDSDGDSSLKHGRATQPYQDANPQLDIYQRSFESSVASSTSRQPLVGSGGGGLKGGGSGFGAHPGHHHPSHTPRTAGESGGGGGGGGQAGEPATCQHRRSSASQHLVHRSGSLQLQRHALDPVAEPEEGQGLSVLPSTKTAPQVEAAAAAAAAAEAAPPSLSQEQPVAGRNRGWSISGRQRAAAPMAGPPRLQPPAQQQNVKRSMQFFVKDSELEMAAVDPLAIIRKLPANSVGSSLGRAHSAPEDLAASLLPLLSRGGSRGGAAGPRRTGSSRDGGADLLLDRVAMGADMRALSANSWTLELLENADLLAALTGVPLAHQVSSSNFDASVHGGTALYGETLAAVISAASQPGGSGDAAVMLQQLRSDTSRRGGLPSSASRDISVHEMARAVLVAAHAGSSTHGGSSAAAGASSNPGRQSREGALARTAFASPTAAASADAVAETPTRTLATSPDGRTSPDAAVATSATECLKLLAMVSRQGDTASLPSRGVDKTREGLSLHRALFSGYPTTTPVLPSHNGSCDVPPSPVSGRLVSNLGSYTGDPLPLLRAVRGGKSDGQGYGEGPSSDVPYASLHLSASSRQLGVALPTSTALPAAAAAAAAIAAATATASRPPAVASSPGWPLVRRPSLALVNIDDQIAAQRAFMEESLHSGELWTRLDFGDGGTEDNPVPLPVPALAATSAFNSTNDDHDSHSRRSRSGAVRGPGAESPIGAFAHNDAASPVNRGLGLAIQPEWQALGLAGLPGMRSPPSLARITECSDIGDTPGAEAAASGCDVQFALSSIKMMVGSVPPAGSGSTRNASVQSQLLPSKGLAPLNKPPFSQPPLSRPLSGAADHRAAAPAGKVVPSGPPAPGAPAPAQIAQDTNRWRSPFEALAVAPLANAKGETKG